MASNLCCALYDYQGRDGEELTISKNETLTVVNGEGSWWKVKNDRGEQGLVPSNYVRPVQQTPTVSGSSRTDLKQDGPAMYQQPDLIERNGPSLNINAVAKFNYEGKQEDELSLRKGDNVIVMEKEADGWWRGRCGARIGWFPFNYVEEHEEPSPPDTEQALSSKEKLFVCGVIALYSFNSGNPEELPFEKGDLMDIVDQPPDDPDWWEARKSDGTVGLVPRNYVEVVHDAEPVFGRPPGEPIASRAGPMAQGGSSASAAGIRTAPSFSREVWFHGKMARREAENILNTQAENGQFIVRESETKVSLTVDFFV